MNITIDSVLPFYELGSTFSSFKTRLDFAFNVFDLLFGCGLEFDMVIGKSKVGIVFIYFYLITISFQIQHLMRL